MIRLLPFLAALGISAVAALMGAARLNYAIWADRDLLRAASSWADFPAMGAEMNGTYMAQVPGGTYYLLLRLLMLPSGGDPPGINMARTVLLMLCLVPVWSQVRALWGTRTALLSVTIPLAAPAVTGLGLQIWNPAISIPLTALASAALLALVRGRPWSVTALAMVLAAAIQVHLSNLALTAGMVLAGVLFGQGSRKRHWLAALAGIGLLMAHYVVVDAVQDWTNTRLILLGQGQPPISHPHFTEVLTIMAAMLGSPESDTGTFPGGIAAWVLRLAAWAGLVGCLWVSMATIRDIAPGVNPRRWWGRLHAAVSPARGVAALAVTVASIGLLLAFNRNSTIYLRYSMPLTIPLAILAAVAAGQAIRRLEEKWPRPVQLGAAWGMSALAALAATWGHGQLREMPWPSPAQQAVAALVAEGLPREAVRERVTVVTADGTARQVYMEYLLSRLRPAEHATGGDTCIAVMPGLDEGTADAAFRVFASGRTGGPAQPLWSRAIAGHGWAIGYNLPEGNCWRSVDNPYIPLPMETRANALCRRLAADGAITWTDSDHAMGVAVRRTYPGFRLCLGLGLAAGRAELVSTQLRGYTGYPSDAFALRAVRLHFLDSAGRDVAEVKLTDEGIGGTGNPTRPPWRVGLPPEALTAAALRLSASLSGGDSGPDYRIDETIRLAHDTAH